MQCAEVSGRHGYVSAWEPLTQLFHSGQTMPRTLMQRQAGFGSVHQ
jgi:hypothetical protein